MTAPRSRRQIEIDRGDQPIRRPHEYRRPEATHFVDNCESVLAGGRPQMGCPLPKGERQPTPLEARHPSNQELPRTWQSPEPPTPTTLPRRRGPRNPRPPLLREWVNDHSRTSTRTPWNQQDLYLGSNAHLEAVGKDYPTLHDHVPTGAKAQNRTRTQPDQSTNHQGCRKTRVCHFSTLP